MRKGEYKPSPLALSFFHWFCHPEFKEEIEGDLFERFSLNSKKYGYRKANWLFAKEVVLLFRPSIIGNIYHLTHTNTMVLNKQNKRLVAILAVATSLLMIPLIAMSLTTEVNWNFLDFVVAGGLLIGTGILLEILLRKIKTSRKRILVGIALLLALVLIWVELAVGLFGAPFSGS